MLDAVRTLGRLDQPDCPGDCGGQVLLEAEAQREVEEQLRVRRPLDEREERRVDGQLRSRFTTGHSRIAPLCIQSQRPWRNGWQFVCWIAVPVEARMCANTSGETRCCARSFEFLSFQAGSTLLEEHPASRGRRTTRSRSRHRSSSPTPNREWRLWSISECFGELLQQDGRSSTRASDMLLLSLSGRTP